MRFIILWSLAALGMALPTTGPLTRMERAKGVGLQMNTINKPIDLSLPSDFKFTGKPSDANKLVEKPTVDNSAALAAINKDGNAEAPAQDTATSSVPEETAAIPAAPAVDEASTDSISGPTMASTVEEVATAPVAQAPPAAVEEAPSGPTMTTTAEEVATAPVAEEPPAAVPAAEEAAAAVPAAEEAAAAVPAAEEAAAAVPAAEEEAADVPQETQKAPAATDEVAAATPVEKVQENAVTEAVGSTEEKAPEIDSSDFSGLSEPDAPPAMTESEIPAPPVAALEEAAVKEVEDMQKEMKVKTVDLSKPSWHLMDNKKDDKKGLKKDTPKLNLDHETSTISGRIFESEYEKQDFEARKNEMKVKFNNPSTKADRVAACSGPCGEGMRLFTVWTTAASTWNPKYTRSVDSALYHHPKATVTVYSSALPSNFLDDFTKLGYDVHVEPINLAERAKGTPLEEWAANLKDHQDGPFYYAHLSDAARMVVLYQEGGVYFDTDVVFVNPMDKVHNVVGWERPDSICNAMLAFDKGNSYVREALTEFNDYYVKDEWAENGPVLLTRLYSDKFHGQQQDVKVLGKSAFYLISWTEIQKYFKATSAADRARDFKLLKDKAYAVHFWNSRSHDLVVDPNSLMGKLFTEACVYCEDISDEIMNPIMSNQAKEAKDKKLFF